MELVAAVERSSSKVDNMTAASKVDNETAASNDDGSDTTSTHSSRFPVSDSVVGCCRGARRLCCHDLVYTDDLILRQERARLSCHLDDPMEDETTLSQTDIRLRCAVETSLCPLGCKHPMWCGARPAAVWSFRAYQLLLVVLLFVFLPLPPLLNTLCIDAPGIGVYANEFHCPALQNVIAKSRYTQNVTAPAYAGALRTMQALEEAGIDSWYTLLDQTSFFKGTNKRIKSCSFILNMTDPNPRHPSNVQRRSEWIKCRNSFLDWRGQSTLMYSALVAAFFLSLVTLVIAVMIAFGTKSQKDDLDECVFPPLLEIKKGRPRNGVSAIEVTETDFHFVRARALARESMVCLGMGVGVPFVFIVVNMVNPTNPYQQQLIWIHVFAALVIGPGLGVVFYILFAGLVVQMTNATTLSNLLVQLNISTALSAEVRCQKLKDWEEYYKTSVGALHVWSNRIAPLFGGVLLFICTWVVENVAGLLSLYTTIIGEPDIIESDRFKVIMTLKATTREMEELTITTIVLLALVGAISTVATRYQRLHLLIETIGLPEFNSSSNAAVTIFEVPITTETTVAILQLLFVQSAVLALAVLGG